MGKKFPEIEDKQLQFINEQKMFFVGSATADSRINISPKGMDSFRVMDKNRVVWLNVTGSGNETAAHMQRDNRMTIMFCAFEGKPKILRLYGTAQTIHVDDAAWDDCYALFDPLPGARQIFDMHVALACRSMILWGSETCSMNGRNAKSAPLAFNTIGRIKMQSVWMVNLFIFQKIRHNPCTISRIVRQ